ncbi:MAG: VWA domain-containing protein, partial [Bacteroidota bacterium]
LPSGERPATVIVAILTDGLENASRDYSPESVREAVAACTADGWEFVFLAAGQDAVMSASKVGISAANAMPFVANANGTKAAFRKMASAVSEKRRK